MSKRKNKTMQTQTSQGKILYKNILPSVFAVTYQCPCGGLVEAAWIYMRALAAVQKSRSTAPEMAWTETEDADDGAPRPSVPAAAPVPTAALPEAALRQMRELGKRPGRREMEERRGLQEKHSHRP